MTEEKKQRSWTDWLIHIVVVTLVLLGFGVPYALKGAEHWFDWTPPPAIKSALDWLPG